MPKVKTTKRTNKKKVIERTTKSPAKTGPKSILKTGIESTLFITPGDGPVIEKDVQFLTTEVEMHLSDLEFEFEDSLDFDDFEFERTIIEDERSERDEKDSIEFEDSEKVEEEYISEESDRLGSVKSVDDDKFAGANTFLTMKIPKKKDFFMTFGGIPKIDEILLDPSDLEEPGTKFIDDEITKSEEEEEQTSIMKDISSFASSSVSSEFEYEIYTTEEEEEDYKTDTKKEDPRYLFDRFIDVTASFDEEAFLKMVRLNELQLLQEDTASFLEQLIEYAVEEAEKIIIVDDLRSKLDKIKLIKALATSQQALTVENKANKFLHKKSVEYYKRQKNFVLISPDSPDYLDMRVEHFNRVLIELNQFLGKESVLQEEIDDKVNVVLEELEDMQENLKIQISALNTLMRETFENRSERFRSFVEKEMSKMSALQRAISQERIIFLTRLNTFNSIKTKIYAIDDLGDNLRLTDYQNLSHEVNIIIKKFEDLTEKHYQMCHRFLKWTAIIAHMREKRKMVHNTVLSQKEVFQEVFMKKLQLRAYVHDMRLNHVRMQKEIWYKSANSGLVDKPALCLDYDMTVEQNIKLREKVKSLKMTLAKILKKIRICEERKI